MAYSPLIDVQRVSGRRLVIAVWTLQVLSAAMFLTSGIAKLAGATAMVVEFEMIGAGQWFRYLTGMLEIAGAIGLLVPRLTFYGAALLAMVMTGAVLTHLLVLGGSPGPAFVLLVLTGTIAWLRRSKMK
jgi:uncharacterized membrane protein YphA (DoxX/SURF4 family)